MASGAVADEEACQARPRALTFRFLDVDEDILSMSTSSPLPHDVDSDTEEPSHHITAHTLSTEEDSVLVTDTRTEDEMRIAEIESCNEEFLAITFAKVVTVAQEDSKAPFHSSLLSSDLPIVDPQQESDEQPRSLLCPSYCTLWCGCVCSSQ